MFMDVRSERSTPLLPSSLSRARPLSTIAIYFRLDLPCTFVEHLTGTPKDYPIFFTINPPKLLRVFDKHEASTGAEAWMCDKTADQIDSASGKGKEANSGAGESFLTF